MVSCTLADGQVQSCGLGKMLFKAARWASKSKMRCWLVGSGATGVVAQGRNQCDEAGFGYVTSCSMPMMHPQVQWQQLLGRYALSHIDDLLLESVTSSSIGK